MDIKYTKGFLKDLEKLFHWKYAPLRWWKAFKRIPREIKWKYQRMKRGWADCDVWDMDKYLAEVVPQMLAKLRDNHNGCPHEYFDGSKDGNECEAWENKLNELIDGFRKARKVQNMEYENAEECEKLIEEFQEQWNEMGKVFFGLWD